MVVAPEVEGVKGSGWRTLDMGELAGRVVGEGKVR